MPINLGMNGQGLGGLRSSAESTNASRERMAQAAALAQGTSNIDPRKLRVIEDKAREFEGVFLAQMLEYGFQDISTNPLGDDKDSGFADDTYRSLLLSEYGKKMAQVGGIGIADHVKQAMIQSQEVGHVVQ